MLWVTDLAVIAFLKQLVTTALPLVKVVDATGITAEIAKLGEELEAYRVTAEYPATQHKGVGRAVQGRTRKFVIGFAFSNPYVDTTSFEHSLATTENFIQIDLPEGKRRYPVTLSGFSDMSLGKSPNCNNQIALTFTIAE